MGPTYLRINAVTRANREEVIARVRAALAATGAWIVDVNLFSNQSICLSFEIPAKRTSRLREALTACGLSLTEDSEKSLASLKEIHEPDPAIFQEPDIAGTLQITFIHNEPELRIEVPKIPG